MWNTDFISEDDLQLTVFIEERNQQSMDYFYDKYSPALYGTIFRITNDEHLAEQCLTATFLKAWNEMAAFRSSGTSLFSWLLNISRQCAFKVLTKEKDGNSEITNFVNAHDQQNSAFELVYFKGLSVMQAAESSGITVTALKTNLRRDLQNMKDKLEKA